MASLTTAALPSSAERSVREVALRLGIPNIDHVVLQMRQEYVLTDWQLSALDSFQWKSLGAPIGLAVAVHQIIQQEQRQQQQKVFVFPSVDQTTQESKILHDLDLHNHMMESAISGIHMNTSMNQEEKEETDVPASSSTIVDAAVQETTTIINEEASEPDVEKSQNSEENLEAGVASSEDDCSTEQVADTRIKGSIVAENSNPDEEEVALETERDTSSDKMDDSSFDIAPPEAPRDEHADAPVAALHIDSNKTSCIENDISDIVVKSPVAEGSSLNDVLTRPKALLISNRGTSIGETDSIHNAPPREPENEHVDARSTTSTFENDSDKSGSVLQENTDVMVTITSPSSDKVTEHDAPISEDAGIPVDKSLMGDSSSSWDATDTDEDMDTVPTTSLSEATSLDLSKPAVSPTLSAPLPHDECDDSFHVSASKELLLKPSFDSEDISEDLESFGGGTARNNIEQDIESGNDLVNRETATNKPEQGPESANELDNHEASAPKATDQDIESGNELDNKEPAIKNTEQDPESANELDNKKNATNEPEQDSESGNELDNKEPVAKNTDEASDSGKELDNKAPLEASILDEQNSQNLDDAFHDDEEKDMVEEEEPLDPENDVAGAFQKTSDSDPDAEECQVSEDQDPLNRKLFQVRRSQSHHGSFDEEEDLLDSEDDIFISGPDLLVDLSADPQPAPFDLTSSSDKEQKVADPVEGSFPQAAPAIQLTHNDKKGTMEDPFEGAFGQFRTALVDPNSVTITEFRTGSDLDEEPNELGGESSITEDSFSQPYVMHKRTVSSLESLYFVDGDECTVVASNVSPERRNRPKRRRSLEDSSNSHPIHAFNHVSSFDVEWDEFCLVLNTASSKAQRTILSQLLIMTNGRTKGNRMKMAKQVSHMILKSAQRPQDAVQRKAQTSQLKSNLQLFAKLHREERKALGKKIFEQISKLYAGGEDDGGDNDKETPSSGDTALEEVVPSEHDPNEDVVEEHIL